MLILLKDVDYREIEEIVKEKISNRENIEIIRDSDYLNSRNSIIKDIWKNNHDTVVLAIYDINYLKWSFVYFLTVYFGSRGKAFVVDRNGYWFQITSLYLFGEGFKAFFSFVIQIINAFAFKIYLPRISSNSRLLKNTSNYRIAYLRTTDSFNLKAGGSLGHTIGIIDGFTLNGNDVYFYGIDNIDKLQVFSKKIVKPNKFYNLLNFFNRLSFCIKFNKEIKSDIKKGDFDFIYQRASRDNFSGTELAIQSGIPLVLEFNSFLKWELAGASHPLHKLFIRPTIEIEKFNLECADLIVTVSNVLRDQLTTYGVDPNKILVCPNAVDSRRFFFDSDGSIELKKELGIPLDSIIVGFSGTFGFWHGVDVMVEALQILANNYPDNYFLLIGDGPNRKFSEDTLSRFPNVKFVGVVPYSDMNKYLSVCDILISPHNTQEGERFIGSPTKLFEYMACEKIIIASKLDQISEIIHPSISINSSPSGLTASNIKKDEVGITVSPGSVAELVFAIQYAFSNIDKLRYLGKNARDKACKKHSWEKTAASIIEKLEEIMVLKKC